jgi:putative tryptophan/tyrosine transport system substrate-binding protein
LLTLAVSKFRSAAVFSGSELCYPFGHTHGRRWPVRRRDFIALFGGSAAWPLAARAQQAARLREVAVWMARPNDMEGQRRAAAFRERLQVLGWTVGRNIRTDYHWVTGDIDRTRMAKEIVEQQPDVIVVESTVGVEALARESSTIPMIFVNLADPVGSGFVETLRHPGRNITGFMGLEPTLGSKWPELLKEIAPTVAQLGFLFDPDTAPYAEPFLRRTESAARLLGVEVTAAHIRNDAEIEHAITRIASNPGGGLIVLPDPTTNTRFEVIIAMTARYRVPAIYAWRYQVVAGGLISYGVDIADTFRGAAVYVDHLLRGARPGDLPVQAPTRFTVGKILGAPYGHEHGAAMARSGQARRSPRSARAGLRLVHRGLRHT